MPKKDIDKISGIETTGHEWDGIKELNNPMPRWWLNVFYLTIVFAIGYMIYYPAVPLLNDFTWGISGQTNRKIVEEQLAAVRAERQGVIDRLNDTELDLVRDDEELHNFAIAGGKSLFKVHCVQCHGTGAQGAPGYPNLNDDEWVWGGDLENIYLTIAHGARSDLDEQSRVSDMPRFGADQLLERNDIFAVAEYVLKISDQEHDTALAEKGAAVFAENCVSCHGEKGQGVREAGGPSLADAIWLYGGERKDIIAQINRPKHGVMPAWLERLGPANVKQLALYIHSLGGGE